MKKVLLAALVWSVLAIAASAENVFLNVRNSSTGNPVALAIVAIYDQNNNRVAWGATDANGDFVSDLQDAYQYWVSVSKSGYYTQGFYINPYGAPSFFTTYLVPN